MTGLSYRMLLATVSAARLTFAAFAAIAAGSAVAAKAEPAAVASAPASPLAVQDPGVAKRELLVAHDVMRKQRITAANASQLQLLFPDQSSLTLARNAEMSIDEFRYDPRAQSGTLAATVRKGLVRYVSGKIALDKGVAFASPGGVVSLRGGIALIKVQNDARGLGTEAILLSGGRMCLAANGQRRCTNDIDTAITGRRGEMPAAPVAIAADTIQRWFGRLEGLSGYQLRRADAVQ